LFGFFLCLADVYCLGSWDGLGVRDFGWLERSAFFI